MKGEQWNCETEADGAEVANFHAAPSVRDFSQHRAKRLNLQVLLFCLSFNKNKHYALKVGKRSVYMESFTLTGIRN